jgi:hypothetical protein
VRERAVARRREAEVRIVLDDRQTAAIALVQERTAAVGRAVVGDDDVRERRIVAHFGEREHRVERGRDLVSVVPAHDDDVDARH